VSNAVSDAGSTNQEIGGLAKAAQKIGDVIKLITKEGVIPSHVNKFFYILAPWIAVVLALISISVIPFGPEIDVFGVKTWMQLTDLNIGILFVLAVSSVGV